MKTNILIFLLLILLLFGCKTEPVIYNPYVDPRIPAMVDFSADSTISRSDSLFTKFTDRSIGVIDYWRWVFGDGQQPVDKKNPTHLFTSPGYYDVTLTVWGPGGNKTLTKSAYITVKSKMPYFRILDSLNTSFSDYDLGKVFIRRLKKFSWTVSNSLGVGTLHIDRIKAGNVLIDGLRYPPSILFHNLPTNIFVKPECDTSISIQIHPVLFGSYQSYITIYNNSKNTRQSVINFHCNCPWPAIKMDVDTLNLGSDTLGSYSVKGINISNVGELNDLEVWVDSPSIPVFKIENPPGIIPADSSIVMNVRFTPVDARQYIDSIIVHNNSKTPGKKIYLVGIGVE